MLIDDLPRLTDDEIDSLPDHATIAGVPTGAPTCACSDCNGSGLDPKTGERCDTCAGSGGPISDVVHRAIARAQETEKPADDIRAFLASVRPIRGCTYGSDERFHSGRGVIERIALSLEDAEPAPLVEELGDAVYFLSNVEPIHRDRCYACADGRPGCGENLVLEFIADRIAEDAKEHVRPLDEAIGERRHEQASNEGLAAELRKAFEAIHHVDALVSTAARAIKSGEACDADSVAVLEEFAWPQIEATRVAIEAALALAGDPMFKN